MTQRLVDIPDDLIDAAVRVQDARLAEVARRMRKAERENWGPVVSWATIERDGVKSGWPLYQHDIDAMRDRQYDPGVTTIVINPNK